MRKFEAGKAGRDQLPKRIDPPMILPNQKYRVVIPTNFVKIDELNHAFRADLAEPKSRSIAGLEGSYCGRSYF